MPLEQRPVLRTVVAQSMAFVVGEPTLVARSVLQEFPETRLRAVFELAPVDRAVRILVDALAMRNARPQRAAVAGAVAPQVTALTGALAVHEVALVDISVGPLEPAASGHRIVLELARVEVAGCQQQRPLAVADAVLKLPFVPGAVGPGQHAGPGAHAVDQFAFVDHRVAVALARLCGCEPARAGEADEQDGVDRATWIPVHNASAAFHAPSLSDLPRTRQVADPAGPARFACVAADNRVP